MPHLSTRISDDEARQLDAIAKRRRITGRGARSQVVRALIAEEQERQKKSRKPPEVADEDELKKLLTVQARKGNVAAMKELRALLDRKPQSPETPAGDQDDADDQPPSKVTPLEAVRARRAKR